MTTLKQLKKSHKELTPELKEWYGMIEKQCDSEGRLIGGALIAQGDTALLNINKASKKLKKKVTALLDGTFKSLPLTTKSEHLTAIVAHGEVTGHYHGVINDGGNVLDEVSEHGTRRISVSNKPAVYAHQEHLDHVLSPDVYLPMVQYEYYDEGLRQVQD
jgi:hypothetical protein